MILVTILALILAFGWAYLMDTYVDDRMPATFSGAFIYMTACFINPPAWVFIWSLS